LSNLIQQKNFCIYQYKLILKKIFCITFSSITVYGILIEVPNIIFAGTIGNQKRYINDNHGQKPKELLDLARDVLRRKHYSVRTEEAYIGWIVHYLNFHKKCHPKDM
jgi:hypothetical protein